MSAQLELRDPGQDAAPPGRGGAGLELAQARRRANGLWRRWPLLLVAVGAIFLVAWISRGHLPPPKPANPGPALVAVDAVRLQDVPQVLSAIGAAQPWRSVAVRAQVAGRLVDAPVGEGAAVKRGRLIAALDAAPFEAALMQAEGALARDQAQLENARVNLARSQTLVAKDMISHSAVDTQTALVKQGEAIVHIDQGAVAAAKVNLGYTQIRAPFDGKLGVRYVDPGNLISPTDSNGIMVVNQMSPMAVVFGIPQGEFQKVAQASHGFTSPLHVDVFSQDSGERLASGRLSIADNRVDPATGTVQLKAQFENGDERLWPGQLLNVRLTLGVTHGAKTAPSRAVGTGPNGPFVYVVRSGKALLKPVRVVSATEGVSILEGDLKPGDTLVTDGQLGLRPGGAVRVQGGAPKAAP